MVCGLVGKWCCLVSPLWAQPKCWVRIGWPIPAQEMIKCLGVLCECSGILGICINASHCTLKHPTIHSDHFPDPLLNVPPEILVFLPQAILQSSGGIKLKYSNSVKVFCPPHCAIFPWGMLNGILKNGKLSFLAFFGQGGVRTVKKALSNFLCNVI